MISSVFVLARDSLGESSPRLIELLALRMYFESRNLRAGIYRSPAALPAINPANRTAVIIDYPDSARSGWATDVLALSKIEGVSRVIITTHQGNLHSIPKVLPVIKVPNRIPGVLHASLIDNTPIDFATNKVFGVSQPAPVLVAVAYLMSLRGLVVHIDDVMARAQIDDSRLAKSVGLINRAASDLGYSQVIKMVSDYICYTGPSLEELVQCP